MSAQANANRITAESLGLDWDAIAPKATQNVLDFTDALLVPSKVLGRFKSARGLGRHIAAQEQYKGLMVRTNPEDGKVYILRKV